MTDASLSAVPVRRLIIWRHGRTEWNADGRFQGQLDPPLDDVGREQAARAAVHLRAEGLLGEDPVVVSSDLRRAAETADTLTGLLGLTLTVDPRLREHGLGTWEGLTRDEVAARYPDQYADWVAGRPVRNRGGEEPADVSRRALAALNDLPEAATAVVVTHGGTAGRLLEALLELASDHRRIFGPLGNCAWSELTAHSGRWRLIRHNSVAPQPAASRAADAPAVDGAVHGNGSAGGNGSGPPAESRGGGGAVPGRGDAEAVR